MSRSKPARPLTLLSGPLRLLLVTSLAALLLEEAGSAFLPQVCVSSSAQPCPTGKECEGRAPSVAGGLVGTGRGPQDDGEQVPVWGPMGKAHGRPGGPGGGGGP